MIRKSIVLKIFMVTFISFFLFYSLFLISQVLFFEKFYFEHKTVQLSNNLKTLGPILSKYAQDQGKMAELTGEFMNQNNVTLSLLNKDFTNEPLYSYRIELLADGEKKTILLSGDGIQFNDVPSQIKKGDRLRVDGFYIDEAETLIQPVTLSNPSTVPPEEGLDKIEGKVTAYTLPTKRSFNAYYQESLNQEILKSWNSTSPNKGPLIKGQTIQYEWTDEWSGVPYILLIRKVTLNGDPHYLIASTNLQPVDEAVETIKLYFIYFAVFGLFLLFIVSVFYSRILSKPLISLSRTAGRMANLDFPTKVASHSTDEFGALENSLQTMSTNLKSALEELEMANQKLLKDVDAKQKLVELHKEFTGNVSHELKTPLGIMTGFAEGLQDGVAEHKKDRYLSHILHEIDHMNEIIMDLLLLSKYEAEAIKLHIKSFSISRLINLVLDTFTQQLAQKSLEATVTDHTHGFVQADKKRIEQVLVNLLSNAITHSSPGTSIFITLLNIADEIEIRIENKGQQIPNEQIERLWEKFYRIETSRSRKTGGTGLGLAIVSQILKLHSRAFGVENTTDGVVFFFRLKESERDSNG